MQIQTLLFMLCGILSINGSPLDIINTVDTISTTDTLDTLDTVDSVSTVNTNKTVDNNNTVDTNDTLNTTDTNNTAASVETITPAEALKPIEVDESLEIIDDNLSAIESVETNDNSNTADRRPIFEAASIVVQSTSIYQSIPIVTDVFKKMGPVELGLRNVVATSSAATEEIYLDMTSMSAKTSHMINSNTEILTARAMNNLYVPLNKVENNIKKTEECGKRYEETLNMVFKDIDSSLKECSKNLTAINEQYKNDNIGILTALSIAAEEMSNLPKSCDIAQNFAVGTFCIVNNLAEINNRVLADVNIIKQSTLLAEEMTQRSLASTVVCHRKLVTNVTDKLAKLLKEITEKCIERKS